MKIVREATVSVVGAMLSAVPIAMFIVALVVFCFFAVAVVTDIWKQK